MGGNEAPGPDGILNWALKLAMKSRQGTFAELFETFMFEEKFLTTWKR